MRAILFCWGLIFLLAAAWSLLSLSSTLGPFPMVIAHGILGFCAIVWAWSYDKKNCRTFLLLAGLAAGCAALLSLFGIGRFFLGSGIVTWFHLLMGVVAVVIGVMISERRGNGRN